MISFFEAKLSRLAIHKVGNKQLDDSLVLSEQPLEIDDEILEGLLMQYLLAPFQKTVEVYRLFHPAEDLSLNEVFHFADLIFNSPESFQQNSKQLARHLHDISNHPNIKSGELYFAYFNNLQIEGELLDVIGIFKSESKEPFLTIKQKQKEFKLSYEEEAINLKKLDKGCLIFNTEKGKGYKVAVVDQTNRSEALYWIDEFLKLKVRNDNYNQTNNALSVYKSFVTQLEDDFDLAKTDKIDLLNRSIKYFKERDTFDINEFSEEVIGNAEGIEAFNNFRKNYEDEYDTEIPDEFSISNVAVKKQARAFKSILKLDKNFHIYIHGNPNLIQQGVESDGRKFYKIYYEEEL